MKLEIIPYQSAGVIKLGMKKEEINSILKMGFRFSKSKYTNTSHDIYFNENIKIEYNEFGSCITISISQPSQAIYKTHDLLNSNFGFIKSNILDSGTQKIYSDGEMILLLEEGLAFWFEDEISETSIPKVSTIYMRDTYEPYMSTFEILNISPNSARL